MKTPQDTPKNKVEKFKFVQKVYHFGIIDYLTKYDTKKKFEREIKSLGKIDTYKEELSVAPAIYYGDRFENFMAKNILIPRNEQYLDKKIFIAEL